jgi:predicted GIY-YIG superfamily endonuclease
MGDAALWIDYVYLDTDERRQFAQVQHKNSCIKQAVLKNKYIIKYLLVKNVFKPFFATLSNCGDFLIVITTTFIWKHIKGTRLIADPNGKNVMNWNIRSQFPKINLKIIIDSKPMGIIYCITFPSGKIYIGQTRQKLEKRLTQHKSCKDDTLISRAFKKYDTYKVDVLLIIDNSLLDEYEIKFIEIYNSLTPYGYNSRTGGQDGYHFSNEIREKCSKSQRKTNCDLPMYIYTYKNGYRCRPIGRDEKMFNYSYLSNDINFLLAKEYIEGKNDLYNKYVNQNNLPKYICRVIRKERSGYRCTLPGYEKHFTSMKLSDDKKFTLVTNYLKLIMEKVQRLNDNGLEYNILT